jgi:hypothetical protein
MTMTACMRRCAILGLIPALSAGMARGQAAGDAPAPAVVLRDGTAADAGSASHVRLEMTAQGQLWPARAPEQPASSPDPKPMALTVQSRYDFDERPRAFDASGRAVRTMRWVRQAAVAINGDVRPLTTVLRRDVSTLAVRLRDSQALVTSPGGPLTRAELDVVQGAADPITWSGFLSPKAVAVGETWALPAELARAVSEYENLAANTLRAKLEALDDASATIRVGGEVRGAVRGGEGVMTIDGTVRYDRRTGRISEVTLHRTEARGQGHIELKLRMEGTITARRTPLPSIPPELSDSVLDALPSADTPSAERLRFHPPEAPYVVYHDRDWHLVWEDARLAVLKRLDHGEMLAQCNLSIGPDAGAGQHQDPSQFRDDIKEALGRRFARFAGAGEIGAAGSEGYAYKVAAQGLEGDREILWYYYLLASPAGKQVLATFTLNLADKDRLGQGDLDLIGSIDWRPAEPGAP